MFCEAGSARQAVINGSMLEYLLLLYVVPGRFVLYLVSDHDVALLAGLSRWQRTDGHDLRQAGILVLTQVSLVIIVTSGAQETCLARALVELGSLLEALLLREGLSGQVGRLVQKV